MHYKNRKQGQLNGVIDREKRDYDIYNCKQYNSRKYIREIKSILSSGCADYLLGMDSDSFLNMIQSNNELNMIVQKNIVLNSLDNMFIEIESQLNDNILLRMSLEHYNKSTGLRKVEKNKNNTFDLFDTYHIRFRAENYTLVEISGVICKMYIDLEVSNEEFDTPNIKLVNAIISNLCIVNSGKEFKNKSIGGLLWIQDTKDYIFFTEVYADEFVFKNLSISYYGYIGDVKDIHLLSDDNENIKNVFCECLNCNIIGFNYITSGDYGFYRRFGNNIISNSKFER